MIFGVKMLRKFTKLFINNLKSGNVRLCAAVAKKYFVSHASILRLKAMDGPLLGIIAPTYRCNLKCGMCNFWKQEPGSELETGEFFKIIDDLAGLGTKAISFSGGEPLLRKDIFGLIKYGKRRGLIVHLATNGTLVDEENARKLRDSEIDAISVSLDGACANAR
jgi:MoaA/NifB/PqqE/SkfB family radical SAM enzyme